MKLFALLITLFSATTWAQSPSSTTPLSPPELVLGCVLAIPNEILRPTTTSHLIARFAVAAKLADADKKTAAFLKESQAFNTTSESKEFLNSVIQCVNTVISTQRLSEEMALPGLSDSTHKTLLTFLHVVNSIMQLKMIMVEGFDKKLTESASQWSTLSDSEKQKALDSLYNMDLNITLIETLWQVLNYQVYGDAFKWIQDKANMVAPKTQNTP